MGETHPTPAENTSAVSKLVEGRPGVIEGDIDQRMANLLKDHQEMGARPEQEPTSTGDTYGSTYPLRPVKAPAQKATAKTTKKATKKK